MQLLLWPLSACTDNYVGIRVLTFEIFHLNLYRIAAFLGMVAAYEGHYFRNLLLNPSIIIATFNQSTESYSQLLPFCSALYKGDMKPGSEHRKTAKTFSKYRNIAKEIFSYAPRDT